MNTATNTTNDFALSTLGNWVSPGGTVLTARWMDTDLVHVSCGKVIVTESIDAWMVRMDALRSRGYRKA